MYLKAVNGASAFKVADQVYRPPKKDVNDLLAILTLEHVHDCDRDESGYFAEIDPADPIVEDICLLADGLRDVMRRMNIVGTDPTAVV